MDQIAAVRIVFDEGWNRENFEPLGGVLAPEFTFHVRGISRRMDVATLQDIIAGWRAGFPDLHFEIRTVVATGDHAALHATLTGTHRGSWNGLEPTGRSVEVEHMFFFRFEAGRMAEVWELLDRPALDRQLAGEA